MTTIITRILGANPKNAVLTNEEIDNNFINLNTDKLDKANNLSELSDKAAARSNLGLGNVNNTSDADKPISTAVQTALTALSAVATSVKNGLMSAADKAKLNGIATGATANASNAFLLDRANHTGTQPMSTIEGLEAAIASTITTETLNAALMAAVGGNALFPNVTPDIVTTTEDTPISGNVLTNDTTLPGSLYIVDYTVQTISGEFKKYTAGVTSVTNPTGTFVLRADGSWNLTPRANVDWNIPLIKYTVSNGVANKESTLKINITAVNDAPIAAPDALTVLPNNSVTVTPLGNDFDVEGNAISITKLNGSPVNPGIPVTIANGTVTYHVDNSFTVTPDTDFEGVLSFTYSITDGITESTGNVSVYVAPIANGGGTSNYREGDNPIVWDWANTQPAKNNTVVEPTTGATIKRLTDVVMDAPGRVALFNAYSRYPVENVTGEYVLAFWDNSTSCTVLNRVTGGVVASLAYDNSGLGTHTVGAYHEVRWHYTLAHPYRVYFVRGTQFWMIDDVRNQAATRTMIRDFADAIDWADIPYTNRKIYMDQEGNSSLDSNHWAWMAAYYDGSTWKVRAFMHYEVLTNKLDLLYPADTVNFTTSPPNEKGRVSFSHRPNMVEMVPDGSGVLIHNERAYVDSGRDDYISSNFEAPYIWPIDFKPTTFQPFRVGADATHGGWASKEGVWYLVQSDNRRDFYMAVPCTGPNKGYGNDLHVDVMEALSPHVIDMYHDITPYPGIHVGLTTGNADGWAFISTYSSQSLNVLGRGNTLFMIQLKPIGQGVTWQVAPSCNQFPMGIKADYNEAPASINLAGTRLMTCGDWNGTSPFAPNGERYVDMYEISLPDNWWHHFDPVAVSNSVAPSLSGSGEQNSVINADNGIWAGYPAPTLSGVWKRNNVVIDGATGLSYTPTTIDIGKTIKYVVTGTNGHSTLTVESNTIGPITAIPIPGVSTAPSITGTPQEGQVLYLNTGTWTNSPTSYSIQWYRGNTPISGMTADTYTVVAADIGFRMHAVVIASNSYGPSDPANSNNTEYVTPMPGSITRYTDAVSIDSNPGYNTTTRNSGNFISPAGSLIVVSVDWNTNSGANTGVSISDAAGNTYVAGSVVTMPTLNARTQQFWCLSSAAFVDNFVTLTNAAPATPLNVSVVVYTSSAGTSWAHTGEVTLGTAYVAAPVESPAINAAADSVLVAHYYQYYSIQGAVDVGVAAKIHEVGGTSWTAEKLLANATDNVTFVGSTADLSYTRMAVSVQAFRRI